MLALGFGGDFPKGRPGSIVINKEELSGEKYCCFELMSGSPSDFMATPPLPTAERFLSQALSRCQPLLDSQREALDRAAALCTEAIAREGLVHLFGCGHSRMLCEEMTPRQGCFVGWHTIVELGLTFHNLIVGPNGLRQSLHL
jgi:hypothetical protein